MSLIQNKPIVFTLPGIYYVDERGVLIANNNLILNDFKRFYVIRNHKLNFVRAWHGHKLESKAIICLRGAVKVGIVPINDFSNPNRNQKVTTFVLDSSKAEILKVPSGYANGFMNLTEDAELLIFSDKTLEESENDDFRYPFDYWDIWNITQC